MKKGTFDVDIRNNGTLALPLLTFSHGMIPANIMTAFPVLLYEVMFMENDFINCSIIRAEISFIKS